MTLRLMADDAATAQPPAPLTARELVALLRDAGIGGRGGAGFPTWRKVEAVAGGRGRPVVIANAAEGEPASGKDAWLLTRRPHLVLEGLAVVANALDAREVYLYVGRPTLVAPLQRLANGRRDRHRVHVVDAPAAFLAGEETAAINWLSGRAAAPRTKPPLVVHEGLMGRPTLVQNVETLAQVALITRHGAGWFREAGTPDEPGTLLLTVTGAVQRPGIVEAEHGTALADVLQSAGGTTGPLSAVLLGGYHGGWITAAEADRARLSRQELAHLGTSLGAGVVVALSGSSCGVSETARVLTYLARESAGQCGPCLNGLPHLARVLEAVARGQAKPAAVDELSRVAGLVQGRGACHHPDGSVRLLRSALRVFDGEVQTHLRGHCTATRPQRVLPTAA